jgi:hypothetical protein
MDEFEEAVDDDLLVSVKFQIAQNNLFGDEVEENHHSGDDCNPLIFSKWHRMRNDCAERGRAQVRGVSQFLVDGATDARVRP